MALYHPVSVPSLWQQISRRQLRWLQPATSIQDSFKNQGKEDPKLSDNLKPVPEAQIREEQN